MISHKLPYYIFKTSIGECAIAWNKSSIVHIQLPNKNKMDLEKILTRKYIFDPKPPISIKSACYRLINHLEGKLDNLLDIKIDIETSPPFYRAVYNQARNIVPGKTISYGDLAQLAGSPNAFRAVGTALAQNPIPLIIPCHRIIRSDGKIGNFTAFGRSSLKRKLLLIEKNAIKSML